MKHTALKAAAIAFGLVLLVIANFALFQPVKVVPRLGLAPGYALVDETGSPLTSEGMRGKVVVYATGYTHCTDDCYATDSIFGALQGRLDEAELGEVPVRLVTLTVDPERDTPDVLAAAARDRGADPAIWKFGTGSPAALRTLIGTGFELYFGRTAEGEVEYRPGFMIVDGNGILRREYRWGMPSVEGLLKDLRVIAREANASEGAARLAYEAAHLFACYSH
jgi:protein SCO1/2